MNELPVFNKRAFFTFPREMHRFREIRLEGKVILAKFKELVNLKFKIRLSKILEIFTEYYFSDIDKLYNCTIHSNKFHTKTLLQVRHKWLFTRSTRFPHKRQSEL